ncbi:MAG: PQQ-dependent sugar dehydrogenase [Phycisphaerales bacterium]
MHAVHSLALLAAVTALSCSTFSASAQLPQLDRDVYVTGLSSPVDLVQDPSNRDVQYVVEQGGRIRVVLDGVLQGTDFINVSGLISFGGERGLLGLAFPADYETDGRFYLNYTASGTGATHIVRFNRDPNNPLRGDINSREIILTVAQPFENHNAGDLDFGPDGMLYIPLGDGGSGGDPGNRAQTPSTLLGKVLRIDVSPETGYDIPADNPFVDDDPIDALEEIWAFGTRNPYRFSFDNVNLGGTGAMVIGDVGQMAFEEHNYEPAGEGGRNYGWRRFEGFSVFSAGTVLAYEPHQPPILVYDRNAGRSTTGGYIYRGRALGCNHIGRYFYADFITGRVWSAGLTFDKNGEVTNVSIVDHTADLGGVGNVSSFGEDADGELYIVNYSGTVYKLVPQEPTTIASVNPQFGTIVSGGVAELLECDGEKLIMQSAFGFLSSEPNIATLHVIANSQADPAVSLDLYIKTRDNNPLGMADLRMYDYVADRFVKVGNHPTSTTMQLYVFKNISDPDRFLRNDGQIRLRSKHVVVATFSVQGFRAEYDLIQIVANE